ncbi:mucin-2 isoform X2 [Dunckerocampus dactyliophorus]|uniref:mucin-2 isoform X2 n=1 Tax=Dunckerocampus dactyliophorus TaxID=161453 RepID=UPI002406CC64|nr:mucin-2 isoform X2 [Dunckerocampus dactyliophorus]
MLLHGLASFILLSVAAMGTGGIDPDSSTVTAEGGSADDGYTTRVPFSTSIPLTPSTSYTVSPPPTTAVGNTTESVTHAYEETTFSEPSSTATEKSDDATTDAPMSTSTDGNMSETTTATRPPDPTDGSGGPTTTTVAHFTNTTVNDKDTAWTATTGPADDNTTVTTGQSENHTATVATTTSTGPTNDDTTLITTGPANNDTSPMTTGVTTLTSPTDVTTSMATVDPTAEDTSFSTTTPALTVNDTTSLTTAAWTDNTDSMTTIDEDNATIWMTTSTPSLNDTTTAEILNPTTPTTVLTSSKPSETSSSVYATTELITVSAGPPSPAPTTTEGQTGATSHEATSHVTPTPPTTETPPVPTQVPVIVCPAKPCPLESVCLNGTCQCFSGSFLVDGSCTRSQVFPGQLHLRSLNFTNDMFNRSSKAFQNTAENISRALAGAFAGQPEYIRSDVVQLQPGSVIATVNNIFADTAVSREWVEKAIEDAIDSSSQGPLLNAAFSSTDLCGQVPLPCDAATTACTSANGLVSCSCKDGYISTIYSNTSCKACPSGQHAVDNTCKKCAFGYGGFNCSDSSLLAVVVVSCVLGGILLILTLALLSYCCWRRCRGDPSSSTSSPYPAGELAKPWPSDITPLPRATTTWDAMPPSMEMMEAGSTRALVDRKRHTNGVSGSYDLNPDAMKTFKDKNPSRYSYLVPGHENPYFLPGDEKKN